MKDHLSNAIWGVLDYVAYPVGMLLAAPLLLHRLGAARYGIWVIAAAAISTGGIIASGFGDANIQQIATARNQGDRRAMVLAVRSTIGVNLSLGIVVGALAWMFAPYLAQRIALSDAKEYWTCLWSLRVASLAILVRAIESVCISTQRAFERYGAAVHISILARILALATAVVLAYLGLGVTSIMIGTGLFMSVGALVQLGQLRQYLGGISLVPSFDRVATRTLLGFGVFSWLQAVSGVIFSQADRLVLGASLGAVTVAAYALCVQMAQPIYGVAASALHFLFPFISSRKIGAELSALRKTVFTALSVNVLFIVTSAAAVLLFGSSVLRLWVGSAIADRAAQILAPVVWSFALLGLNVTGYYAMLALGHVRTITMLSIAGGAAMALLMFVLMPRMGVQGLAIARLAYGAITLLEYIPLLFTLRPWSSRPSVSGGYPVCEER